MQSPFKNYIKISENHFYPLLPFYLKVAFKAAVTNYGLLGLEDAS